MRRPRRDLVGVVAVFAALGVIFGSFASRVPALQEHLHVGAPRLGLALLGSAAGLVISTPLSAVALRRLPPRRWIAAGLLPAALALPTAALVGSVWALLLVLAVFGTACGMVDVAMNTEAAAVQSRAGRRVLSTVHACYSIGALAGAGAGAACAAVGIGALTQWVGTAAAWLLVGSLAVRLLPAAGPAPRAEGGRARAEGGRARAEGGRARAELRRPRAWRGGASAERGRARDVGAGGGARTAGRLPVPRRQLPALAALAVLCLACFLCEGAANDWSAVYLHTGTGAPPALASIAYAAFATTMVAGRLAGDRLANRVGPVRLVRAGGAVGALGLGVGLAVGTPAGGIIGFGLLGAGLAAGVPLVVTAAAALGGTASGAVGGSSGTAAATPDGGTPGDGAGGPAVATVVAVGYLGLLAGPPAIGGLAGLVGLRAALGAVAGLACVLSVLGGFVGSPASEAPEEPLVPGGAEPSAVAALAVAPRCGLEPGGHGSLDS